jgi:Reverse transcriptase (RNA-dependent DNA polymerase)
MEVFADHLYSSELQFGFKKKLSCSHAVYAVRSVCEYYSSRNSTVNVGFLDMSTAFDKVDHCALYLKLMNRKTPVELLNVIINWYSRSDAFVR